MTVQRRSQCYSVPEFATDQAIATTFCRLLKEAFLKMDPGAEKKLGLLDPGNAATFFYRLLKEAFLKMYPMEEAEITHWLVRDFLGDSIDPIREFYLGKTFGVRVRSGWYSPLEGDPNPLEYEIEIPEGRPALKVVGELNNDCYPVSARLFVSESWHHWRHLGRDSVGVKNYDGFIVLRFARIFYYGKSHWAT